MADWYPQRLSERDSWHAGFDAQAAATGTTHGLSAGDVAEIHVDAILVSICADYDVVLRQYVEAWTEWRNLGWTATRTRRSLRFRRSRP